jgi:hypothetical protein
MCGGPLSLQWVSARQKQWWNRVSEDGHIASKVSCKEIVVEDVQRQWENGCAGQKPPKNGNEDYFKIHTYVCYC